MIMDDSLDVTQYLLASSREEQNTIAREAASHLKSKTLKLRIIIQSLQEPLFSEDAVQRSKAVQFLSDVLMSLDGESLPRQEVALLVQFLLKRLENDPAGVKEAVQALQILQAMQSFNASESSTIPDAIFNHVETEFPSQNASTRLEVYKLLDSMLSIHRAEILNMSGAFITGLLALCVKEGDPRNLMICFSMIQVILAEWDAEIIYDQKDALWEAVSRYFPITFRPKPNEPINITADDLKIRLRGCIAATSVFAEQAFPFLLQKLDDQTTANVKKDIMRTMEACVSSYSPKTVSKWSTKLWDSLKYEVLNATEVELAAEAAATLQAVARRLSVGLTVQMLDDTPLLQYINAIVMECSTHLFEKGSRFAKQSSQILESIASASPFAFHLVARGIMPVLIAAYETSNTTVAEKKNLLEAVNHLMDAKFEILRTEEKSAFPAISIIDAITESFSEDTLQGGGISHYRDALGSMFTSAVGIAPGRELSYRIAGLQGLLKLVMLPDFLENTDAGIYIGIFTQVVLDTDQRSEIRNQAINALQQIAPLHPRQILDITFPALLGNLPDILNSHGDGLRYLAMLEVLGKISCQQEIFDTFIRRLLNKLEVVIRSNVSQSYAQIVLVGILYGIKQREVSRISSSPALAMSQHERDQYQNLVKTLYQKVTTIATKPDGSSTGSRYVGLRQLQTADGLIYPNYKFLDLVGKIAMTAIRPMSLEQQKWAAAEIFTLFVESDAQDAIDGAKSPRAALEEAQLNLSDATEDHRYTLILSMYLLAGLRRENYFNFDPQEVCIKVIHGFENFHEDLMTVRMSMINLVILLVNKWNVTSSTKPNTILPQEVIQTMAASMELRSEVDIKKDVHLVSSFTMAANFRGDRSTADLLKLLLNGLDDEKLGVYWSKSFNVLLAPSDILCKENFAMIRPLYKQRLFGICVPTIVERFKANTNQTVKVNYLVALSGILQWIPSAIVLPEIDTLLPLLLQSLETPLNPVKAANLDVILVAIKESPTAVESHIQGIIKRLITSFHNTSADDSNCWPLVRAKALICMAAIPAHLRLTVVLPYKHMVLKELGAAVNDPKAESTHRGC